MLLGAVIDFIWLQLLVVLVWTQCLTSVISLETTVENEDTGYTLPVAVSLKDGDTFDFIIVGAGAAGCAAAARLALLGFDVLLVEAGGDPTALSDIPAASMALLGSEIDWQYPTISNNVSCLASNGRQCRFSRGKCLGGSTSINYMLYTRGSRHDFDYNITDWNWTDLKPYFLRYEGLQVLDQFPRSSVPYHNTTGILKIGYFDDPHNLWYSKLIKGYRALNFPYNQDVNGESEIGVTKVVGYVYKGERMSTARAYLGRKDVQSKLKVAKKTLCTGVIIDNNKVARGIKVRCEFSQLPLQLFARKEVILSAGTIGTPQILMLSGVGPAKHLKKMGIPVHVNLPVGGNISDHVMPPIIVLVDRGINVLRDVRSWLAKVIQVIKFLTPRNGSLTSNGFMDINSFANNFCYNQKQRQLENGSGGCDLPNMQIVHAYIDKNVIPSAKDIFQQATNLNDDVVDQLANASVDNALLIISPIVLTPYSRGKIQLKSKNPMDTPAILPNYLSDSRDVDQMMRSIKIIEDLVQTPDFKKANATILHLDLPGCPDYKRYRKGYWRCYVRHMTYSVFHAVGACSLEKVVDIRLRVKGIKALRVADASIFPVVPRGNTEAPTVAIGERVVDFIQEDLRERS